MDQKSASITRVRIYNQFYDLRGGDPERIVRLASLVDEKMTEVSAATATVDTAKVAILAALTLADDCMAAEEQLEACQSSISDRGTRVLSQMKDSLGLS